MGRFDSDVEVLTRTCLTTLCRSGKVSVTRPIFHCPRGRVLSQTRTMSPTCKLGLLVVHFWRTWRVCRYSRDHLAQNWSARYCTCSYRCLEYNQSINHILFCHKIKTVIHERIGYYFYTCGLGGLRSDLPVFESSSHLTFVGQ